MIREGLSEPHTSALCIHVCMFVCSCAYAENFNEHFYMKTEHPRIAQSMRATTRVQFWCESDSE